MRTSKTLAANEFTVEDYFNFPEKIFDSQFYFLIGSLDVDSLFTNIPLRKTIEVG